MISSHKKYLAHTRLKSVQITQTSIIFHRLVFFINRLYLWLIAVLMGPPSQPSASHAYGIAFIVGKGIYFFTPADRPLVLSSRSVSLALGLWAILGSRFSSRLPSAQSLLRTHLTHIDVQLLAVSVGVVWTGHPSSWAIASTTAHHSLALNWQSESGLTAILCLRPKKFLK